MDLGISAATLIVSIFGLVILLAAAWAVARANYAKTQLEGLRSDVADYKNREERHEKEIQELQRDRDEARTALKALEKVVTGRDLLETLNQTLKNHHDATLTGLSAVHETLEELLSAFAELRGTGTGGADG